MTNLTKEVKQKIVQNNIKRLEQEKYNAEIKAKVFKNIGDERLPQIADQAVNIQKQIDEYQKILDNI